MKRRMENWAIAGVLVGAVAAAEGAAININIGYGSSPAYTGTAAAPDSGTTWNQVVLPWWNDTPGTGTVTRTGLLDSTNGLTAVWVTIENGGGYYVPQTERTMSFATNLMSSFAVISDSGKGSGVLVTVGGLSAGQLYALYLYAQNGGYGSAYTVFTNGAIGYEVVNGGDPGGFVRNRNYAVFTAVADSNGTICCPVSARSYTGGAFNGLQLIPCSRLTTTLNVNFGRNGSPGYTGVAMAPDSGTTWNQVVLPDWTATGTVTRMALADSTNGLTAAWVTICNGSGYWWNNPTSFATNLMDSAALISDAGAGSGVSFTIDGLVAGGTYLLYLYAQSAHHGNTDTTFTDGFLSQEAVNGGDPGGFVLGRNYVVLAPVADSKGTISCSVTAKATAGGALNGFQLMPCPRSATTALNVNLGRSASPAFLTYAETAVAPDTGTNWNHVALPDWTGTPGTGTVTRTALVDSTDGPTAAWVTIENGGGYYVPQTERAMSFATNLMSSYVVLSDSGKGSGVSFTIGGLSCVHQYDLYLYAQNGGYGSATATFTIEGAGRTATNPGSCPTGFIENVNYVHFQRLSAGTDGRISGSVSTPAYLGGAFNGFQVVPTGVRRGTVFMMR
ncbi:MAG: hypothetical protein PHR35_07475 [Kiritimatiellae bacterium]|nr:hypothetical protein [Kiritimatiellia bacterium]